MKKFPKKYIITLLSVTLLVFIIMAVSFKTGNNRVGGAFATVFAPVQKISAFMVNSSKRAVKNIFESSKNAKENDELRARVAELGDELRMVEGYKTENEKLRRLLELKDEQKVSNSTAASVIGREIGELYCTITIDKGKEDGIYENAVVFTPEGLVGRVYETGVGYSKVRTVFDADSSVSARCARSGDMGIVNGISGDGNGGMCVMSYIDKEAKIVQGDSIETSGTGGTYPGGIFIGKVSEIKSDERNLTLQATIEVGVNVRNLDMVLVEVK